MDETLISSDFIWAESPLRLLSSHSFQTDIDYGAMFYEEGLSAVVSSLKTQYFPDKDTSDIFSLLAAIVEDGYRREAFMKPGAFSFVEGIRKAGLFTAVLTANRPLLFSIIRDRFPSLAVDRWFSAVDIGCGKGDCHVYDIIASYYGLTPDECVLFDDAEYALKGAHDAGLRTFRIAGGRSRERLVDCPTIEDLNDFRRELLCV